MNFDLTKLTNFGKGLTDIGSSIASVGGNSIPTVEKKEMKEINKDGTLSDQRLKEIFPDCEDIVDLFGRIHAIDFKYNENAKSVFPEGECHVDDNEHVGVKAQELDSNPVTEGTVSTDPSGYMKVDTAHLTMTNTAVLAEVCRRLEALECAMGIRR